ncbi:DUF2630 family protein [Streptomyces sp. NPDC059651]|uniref:DUF2630 family protein n=1 Tax=unclassified Streptomyces TaxID=2593676 RepID=UPI0036906798
MSGLRRRRPPPAHRPPSKGVRPRRPLGRAAPEPGLAADGRARLRTVETGLDRCRHLPRQRRALSGSGEDPSPERARPADEAERYRS